MYKEFESWLDATIEKGLPVGKGLCFNIYDDGNYSWSIDVIISSSFDPDDDDWATDVVFSSEDAFSFRQVAEWDDVLEDAIQDMLRYLDIEPGAVSVMGLMNDRDHAVQLLIDEDVLKGEYLGCHPAVNTSSLKLRTREVFDLFLPAVGLLITSPL